MLTNYSQSKPAARSKSLFSQLEPIARKTQLITRESKRFSASSFLLALFKSVTTGHASYNEVAGTLHECSSLPMSRQALSKRISESSVKFMKDVLALALKQQWVDVPLLQTIHFNRVIIEDSSQCKLHKKNHQNFPGHGNSKAESSGCKVDLSFDLLTGSPVHQILDKATMQDKTLGKEIVNKVEPGDLVLRDMGYFSVPEFQRIEAKKAFWQSRLPANINTFMESGETLDDFLKSCSTDKVDVTVRLLDKNGQSVRLIAIRAAANIAEKKRRERRAKAQEKGKTPTSKALLRDGWHLMVTNVKEAQLDTATLAALYAVRWQIEITFRAWKQSGNLLKALNRKSKPAHLQTLIYAAILWLVLMMKTAAALQVLYLKKNRTVSLEKLSISMSGFMLKLTEVDSIKNYAPYHKHVLMESRRREPLMIHGIKCLG